MRLLPLCCLLPGLLAACAPGSGLPPLPPTNPADYRLGAGDIVRLTTFGEAQLTGEFRVGDDGDVAVPLLGHVRAEGLTPAAFQTAVAVELERDGLLRNPQVAAEVTTYRGIFVLGEVNKPGQYPYQPGMTMVSAVAVAGGFTYRAVQDHASVMRRLNGRLLEARASREALVQPGDVITVYERRF